MNNTLVGLLNILNASMFLHTGKTRNVDLHNLIFKDLNHKWYIRSLRKTAVRGIGILVGNGK